MQEIGVELKFSSLVLGFQYLSSLPHAFFRSPLVNLSEVEFSTMWNEQPSVDITRSLKPFLFAALASYISFLDFFTAALSFSRISRSSFSSGGVTIPSMISSYPLSSAIAPYFRANSCQLSLVLLNL